MKLEDIIYTPELEGHPELKVAAERASQWIVDAAEEKNVRGEWNCKQDGRGRWLLELRLFDDCEGDSRAAFAPSELNAEYEHHVKGRIGEQLGAMAKVGSFITHFRKLLDEIEGWLKGMSPLPYSEWDQKKIVERDSGEYVAPLLRFVVDAKRYRVEPIAAFIVGANGRAEFVAPDWSYTIVLDGTEWKWIVEGISPHLETVTKDNFLALLRRAVA